MTTLIEYCIRNWLKIGIVLLIILPAGSFVVGSVVLLGYIYWPNQYEGIDFSKFSPNQSHMVIMAHGVNDSPGSWIEPLQKIYKANSFDGQLVGLDWSAYADNAMRCAIDGKRIGKRIGSKVLQSEEVQSLHFVAHSCGSFVIYAACQMIKEHRPNIQVQTTYLDPVSIYGPFWNYGLSHFGTCADYSEAYIDTEDTIPGSNQLLVNTRTYDITEIRKRNRLDIAPHKWPTIYYHQLVTANRAPELIDEEDLAIRKPTGVLEVVTEY